MSRNFRAMLIILSILIIASMPVSGQNLLNQPESVVFDALNERYLVSNYTNGNIVQIDQFGSQSYFDTTLTRVAGLLIKGDTLLVASNLEPYVGLVGYSLATDEMLFYLPIASVGLLNDLDFDSQGNVYMSDYWDNKIFKVSMNSLTYTIFVDTLFAPNGILCDSLHNRLLVLSVNAPGRPILGVDLDDGSISTVVNTNISSLDGITRDSEERIYISSWWSNACYRYDTLYTNPPELVSSGHSGPADIYINRRDDLLCVPNFYLNNVEFIEIYPNSIDEGDRPSNCFISHNYPNPFNVATAIRYTINESSMVNINIYDALGRYVETLVCENKPAGNHQAAWIAGKHSSGLYFFRIQIDNYDETGKMLLLR